MGAELNLIDTNNRKLPPHRGTVTIHEHGVGIYSPTDLFMPYLSGKEDKEYIHDIPGWHISDEEVPTNPKIVYIPSSETDFQYDAARRRLEVYTSGDNIRDGQALAYLSYWLSEGDRQKDRQFSLHSAAVNLDGRGVLLIGDRGAGKTSTVLGLAERYKAKMLSNDLTIIEHDPESQRVSLEEGSKRIRLRLRSVLNRFPDLIKQFPETSGPAWTTKVLVDPRQLGVELAQGPVELAQAFIIHLSHIHDEDVVVKRVNGIAARFELYENLSRLIRASGLSIFGNGEDILGYIPSLETKQTHDHKVDLLKHLINEKGVYSVSGGNLDQICEAIRDLST